MPIDNDPETEVKKKAVFALSQLPKDEGVPLLIEIAQNQSQSATSASRPCSGSASRKTRAAISFFEQILK